ncbi:hypothetical protein B0T17DRAFT_521710 [Bombardia bombarda]|uniref:Uncharacterized protein n=1 Tax=Bombardia bombarda TaxID=252184 RepID=A0AA39XNT3_9PEZI|nr:hypothetical protein B0T17DRAFT_521710 [Bombardia bombarda]
MLIASIFVVLSIFVGSWISYRVPPEGFDCRNAAQLSMLGVWVLSFALDFVLALAMDRLLPGERRESWHYEILFVKDLLMAAAVVAAIMYTQVGIFNRCDCFTLWGRAPLALPQIAGVREVLMERIAGEWPIVTFVWIGIELVMCVAIWWWFGEAVGVYLQKDDGGSNMGWVPERVLRAWGRVCSGLGYARRGQEGVDDGGLEMIVIPGVEVNSLLLDRSSVETDGKQQYGNREKQRSDGGYRDEPGLERWASVTMRELVRAQAAQGG